MQQLRGELAKGMVMGNARSSGYDDEPPMGIDSLLGRLSLGSIRAASAAGVGSAVIGPAAQVVAGQDAGEVGFEPMLDSAANYA